MPSSPASSSAALPPASSASSSAQPPRSRAVVVRNSAGTTAEAAAGTAAETVTDAAADAAGDSDSAAEGPRGFRAGGTGGAGRPLRERDPDPQGPARSTELTTFSRRPVAEARREGAVVSTGLADRLAERRRAALRLRLRQLAAVVAVVVMVAAVTGVLLFSPLLALRTSAITVSGSDGSVEDAQVRDLLAGYRGDSLLGLDMAELSATVGEGLVRVRHAEVRRSWPHGLSVSLEMRVPVAVTEVEDGYEVLDDEAVVLEVVDAPPEGLVHIVAEGAGAGTAEAQASGTTQDQGLSAQQVSAVAQAVGSLEPDTLAQVASGSASENGQVTLTLTSGATVVWGGNEDTALKARTLAVLLQTEASVYDVSSPHKPTTTRSSAQPSGS